MRHAAILIAFGSVLVVAGCSGGGSEGQTEPQQTTQSSTKSGSSSSSSGNNTSSSSSATEPACSPVGAKANDKGVGAYCDSNVKCDASGTFCTGDFGAPAGATFCTRVCNDDSDCGSGAFCYDGDPRGKGCVTNACKGM